MGWVDAFRRLWNWWSSPAAAPVSEPADVYYDLRCAEGAEFDLRGVEGIEIDLRGDQ